MGNTCLVTGCAGFIGFHVAARLLEAGWDVVGIDNLCEAYYPVSLKRQRLRRLETSAGFRFLLADLGDGVPAAVNRQTVTHIVHLAAHAAVMLSFKRAVDYQTNNVIGTQRLFDWATECPSLEHLVYASSSSVYGDSEPGTRLDESLPPRPISPYGATKVANEAQAQVLYRSCNVPVTGLRLFKVYGPWARPDTVFFRFSDRILAGEDVVLFNEGAIEHSFTYIDDVVDGVLRALARPPPQALRAHPVYNLGNDQRSALTVALASIERHLGREARRIYRPLRRGDRSYSHAAIDRARSELGFAPRTPLDRGLAAFLDWYMNDYRRTASDRIQP
jgi:UDP-glucuronate 4-epimerase